jgi:Rps23 Pro-64 3,4-dihydroxylase Tpa1-like proline 4-hydroxylase
MNNQNVYSSTVGRALHTRVRKIQFFTGELRSLRGGLHQIERGGFLKVHLDSNTRPRYSLARRINLLLYLNKEGLSKSSLRRVASLLKVPRKLVIRVAGNPR